MCEALPIDTFLRPNYYELFPLFSNDALVQRAQKYSFAEATLLGPAYIKALIANDPFRDALDEFVAKPRSWQRAELASVLASAGITAEVVQAIASVDRYMFVMEPYRRLSYINAFLPWSQTAGLSPPGLVAIMLERFAPRRCGTYYEIGAGSGYHLACLYELTERTSKLTGYEIDSAFAEHGRHSLLAAGYGTIELVAANGLAVPGDAEVDGVYATAAGATPESLARFRTSSDARYQWLRPLLRAEFENEPSESWLRQRYGTYLEYLRDDWVRQFGCLSTGAIFNHMPREADVLYEVSLVTLEDVGTAVVKRDRGQRESRVVDELLLSLRVEPM